MRLVPNCRRICWYPCFPIRINLRLEELKHLLLSPPIFMLIIQTALGTQEELDGQALLDNPQLKTCQVWPRKTIPKNMALFAKTTPNTPKILPE
jgi:hypothetical protein